MYPTTVPKFVDSSSATTKRTDGIGGQSAGTRREKKQQTSPNGREHIDASEGVSPSPTTFDAARCSSSRASSEPIESMVSEGGHKTQRLCRRPRPPPPFCTFPPRPPHATRSSIRRDAIRVSGAEVTTIRYAPPSQSLPRPEAGEAHATLTVVRQRSEWLPLEKTGKRALQKIW